MHGFVCVGLHFDSFWTLQVVGLDLVDDESKPERRPTKHHMPTPEQWTNVFNPAFSYYAYYCYANLYTLNKVIISSSLSSIFSIFLKEVMVLFNFSAAWVKGDDHYQIPSTCWRGKIYSRFLSESTDLFTLMGLLVQAGDIDHLAATFLLCHNISHGINLRKSPVLQYLYYLGQVRCYQVP